MTTDATSTGGDGETATVPATVAQLGPYDVLCGRDKKCSSNMGNRRFRALINQSVPRYLNCESKFERSKAIGIIVKELQENPQGSVRFFKRVKGSDSSDDNAAIEQLDEKQSREKVAHALRDYASQRRNNQAKQEAASPPRATQAAPAMDQRIFPGSNPQSDLNQNTNSPHAHRRPSPRMSDLLKEEQRLYAEIQALQAAPMNSTSSAAYQGSVDSPSRMQQAGYANHYSEPIQSGRSNNQYNNHYGGGMNHSQNYHQQQQQQYYQQQPEGDEHEGSEGYDDFNVEEYNEFIKPLGSSIRTVDSQTATYSEGIANNPNNSQSGNHPYRQQPLKQPLAGTGEGYDVFDERIEPLRGGNTMSKRNSIEKGGSNRSMKSQGSLRTQGSLRHMDVFEKSGSNRSFKHQGSSRLHDSLGATDLMTMSMETLTLGESDMLNDSFLSLNQSKLGMSMDNSKLDMSMQQSKLDMSMQQSKLDMSLQQSKLDMSCQTLDTADLLGEKRSSS